MSKLLPNWVEPSIQGLTYWIGYKKQLYVSGILNEGAIVSELATLINSNLKEGEKIKCEDYYREMSDEIISEERADIAIYNKKKLQYLIEVKRSDSRQSLINNDFIKLCKLKSIYTDVRCFVLLVCQGKIPQFYVSDDGVADGIKYPIIDTKFSKKAVRVCKSTSSFKEESLLKANYAILIEVIK